MRNSTPGEPELLSKEGFQVTLDGRFCDLNPHAHPGIKAKRQIEIATVWVQSSDKGCAERGDR